MKIDKAQLFHFDDVLTRQRVLLIRKKGWLAGRQTDIEITKFRKTAAIERERDRVRERKEAPLALNSLTVIATFSFFFARFFYFLLAAVCSSCFD